MEIYYKKNDLIIQNSNKKNIVFDTLINDVSIDDFSVKAQWEYEKSWILTEVKFFKDLFFYKFTTDWYRIIIITGDSFELNEEILPFFGDIDLLILPWTKNSAKLYDDLEAKTVLPYGETKDIFFNSLSQNIEEVETYKLKWWLSWDITEFINLKIN